jgi:hypothetical protein
MFARLTVALALATIPVLGLAQDKGQEQEHPKVPKDSIEVTVLGCLKGRVLQVEDVRQTDVQSSPPINQRALRLAGKKPVMEDVKNYDGRRVEVSGLIKKSALIEPGMKFKGGRVVVGGGSSSPGSIPSPVENVVVLDAWSVRTAGGDCR